LGLSPQEWEDFAAVATKVACAVLEQTGLRTVFHHHCAGYVETPEEMELFLRLTEPKLIGLVF
jgi:inosose dehydratase